MMNKYRVHEVAKDFKLNSKDIAEIMTKYSQTPKNHMQVLEERELAVIFDYLTQHNQVDSIESIYADVYHEPKPAQAKPAQPQQSASKPAAKGESRPQSAAPQADKSGEQPRAQGGKPEQAQARPATRVPEKKVVDTRKATAVNLDKYDEKLQDMAEGRTGGGRTDQLTTGDFHKTFSFGQGSPGAHAQRVGEHSLRVRVLGHVFGFLRGLPEGSRSGNKNARRTGRCAAISKSA